MAAIGQPDPDHNLYEKSEKKRWSPQVGIAFDVFPTRQSKLRTRDEAGHAVALPYLRGRGLPQNSQDH